MRTFILLVCFAFGSASFIASSKAWSQDQNQAASSASEDGKFKRFWKDLFSKIRGGAREVKKETKQVIQENKKPAQELKTSIKKEAKAIKSEIKGIFKKKKD
jgi:hypothetical protein